MRTRPWINFEAGCGWIKRIPIIPVCHSGLKVSQIGAPISSFQGLELDDEGFATKFFAAICKHAGFSEQPRIDKQEFMREIRKALEGFTSEAPVADDSIPVLSQLSDIQVEILKQLAEAKDRRESGVHEPVLARRVNLKVTLLRHHVVSLVKDNYVHQGLIMGGPSYYTIKDKGISYLVDLGILK
ncbi:MAG: hypothetical protein AMJ45_07125 [Syntrophobacter sp. DG_60]|nr:MAG: hypothetical protein AMJ45_07125 [Syntrophobacter sp. DG_60]